MATSFIPSLNFQLKKIGTEYNSDSFPSIKSCSSRLPWAFLDFNGLFLVDTDSNGLVPFQYNDCSAMFSATFRSLEVARKEQAWHDYCFPLEWKNLGGNTVNGPWH